MATLNGAPMLTGRLSISHHGPPSWQAAPPSWAPLLIGWPWVSPYRYWGLKYLMRVSRAHGLLDCH